jgi:hypothetical protein
MSSQMQLLLVKWVKKLDRIERRGEMVRNHTSYVGGKERLPVPVYTVVCVVMQYVHTYLICLNYGKFIRFQARLYTVNRVRIELTARQVAGWALVLLLRTFTRRGFVRRQRGRIIWERRCGPSAAYGHRAEHHSHREPLPPQRRVRSACAEQAGPTRRAGSATAALRQFLSPHGGRRCVTMMHLYQILKCYASNFDFLMTLQRFTIYSCGMYCDLSYHAHSDLPNYIWHMRLFHSFFRDVLASLVKVSYFPDHKTHQDSRR